VKVNGKPLREYFPDPYDKGEALKPLVYTDLAGSLNVNFFVRGSGLRAQSNCCAYALSKAILNMDYSHYDMIKELGMHKTDDRVM
jgi:ribosomal protein S9